MKPTLQEKQWLQDYLYQSMAYRETYEEVYDHILLALEDKPAKDFFETNVNNIIEDDFGGSSDLFEMEQKCRTAVTVDANAQYWRNFTSWFKLPLAVCTIIILSFLYCIITKFIVVALLLFLFVLVAPIIIVSGRGFRMGYKFENTKPSLRDAAFNRLTYLVIRSYIFINFFLYPVFMAVIKYLFHYEIPENIKVSQCSFSIFVLGLIVHAAAMFKLCWDEFKTGIIIS